MNNLSSYCGLVDVRIKASDKDLSVVRNLGQRLCNEAKDQIPNDNVIQIIIDFLLYQDQDVPDQNRSI